MRRIINGKMYNTETAEYLAGWTNGLLMNDFNFIGEDLYRKKTGEMFLAVYAGANTSEREGIHPITEERAKHWLEHYNLVDEYIAIFGEPEE